MTPKFAMCDTKRPNGCYVQWERLIVDDCDRGEPDYLSPDNPEEEPRLKAWWNDEWHYVGVRARAHVTIVINGHGFTFSLDSAGLWGIESDSGEEYFAEVFEGEKRELTSWLADFKMPSMESAS